MTSITTIHHQAGPILFPVRPGGEMGPIHAGRMAQSTSLPVDYEIVGYLLDHIEVGKPVRLLRIERNSEQILGLYNATPVLELRSEWYVTRNSVYSVDVLWSPDVK